MQDAKDVLNQDGKDQRMDQDLDLNQDALRQSSGYGMRGWTKIINNIGTQNNF